MSKFVGKNWKELLLIAQTAIIYFGYKNWPEDAVCKPETKIVYKDKIVYVDRTTVKDRVITKPDGTKIEETTRTEEKKEQTSNETKETEQQGYIPPDYHLGVSLDGLPLLFDRHYVLGMDGGLRLGSTPFFLTINPSINFSEFKLNSASIGLRIEF